MAEKDSPASSDARTVPLETIVNALEMADAAWIQYLDRETGKIVSFPSGDNMYIDRSPEDEALAEDVCCNARYEPLPTQRELNEWSIMEDFASAVPDSGQQERLFQAFQARRPFRRFKDTLIGLDLTEVWYAFRLLALHRKAEDWCRENDIPLQNDPETNPYE